MSRAAQPDVPLGPGDRDDPATRVEVYLAEWLDGRPLPASLAEAVRYAVLGPGKRLRPILIVRSAEAVGGRADEALAPAAAIEMIHAFSLVHDDLPALDDDDLRRGRPTLHRHAGEALAILAGDALLGLAVELLIDRLPQRLAVPVCRELIGGCNRMIAGQVCDTLPGAHPTGTARERLETIHRNKTGALIRAACRAGAICGDATPPQLEAVTAFGEAVGLMFQVVDDLLDVTGTTEELGKTAGKDARQDKLTYPALLGVEGSRAEVQRLRGEALEALEPLGRGAGPLRELCDYLSARTR
jgi:geranylgeranyl pyrophosphate synthase